MIVKLAKTTRQLARAVRSLIINCASDETKYFFFLAESCVLYNVRASQPSQYKCVRATLFLFEVAKLSVVNDRRL